MDRKVTMNAFRAALKAYRESSGLDPQAFGRSLGSNWSAHFIRNVENGKENPTDILLNALLHRYGCANLAEFIEKTPVAGQAETARQEAGASTHAAMKNHHSPDRVPKNASASFTDKVAKAMPEGQVRQFSDALRLHLASRLETLDSLRGKTCISKDLLRGLSAGYALPGRTVPAVLQAYGHATPEAFIAWTRQLPEVTRHLEEKEYNLALCQTLQGIRACQRQKIGDAKPLPGFADLTIDEALSRAIDQGRPPAQNLLAGLLKAYECVDGKEIIRRFAAEREHAPKPLLLNRNGYSDVLSAKVSVSPDEWKR